MANAFLLKPLPIVAAAAVNIGTDLGAALNVSNDYAGVIWRSQTAINGTPRAILQLDLGQDRVVDTIMLFGLVGIGAAATAIVSGAADDSGPFTGVVNTGAAQTLYAGSVTPANGQGVALLSVPTATYTGMFRYLRIEFYPPATSDYVQVSRAVVGAKFQPSRNFSFGAGFGVKDLGSLDFSRRGVLLRTRGAKLRTASLSFSSLRKDEVESTVKPLLEYLGNTEMVALCTDPAVDAQRQNRCYFGPLVGDVAVAWRNAAAWEAKTNLVSIF